MWLRRISTLTQRLIDENGVVEWLNSLDSFDYIPNFWFSCYNTGQNPYAPSAVACWISYILIQLNSDQLLC